MSNRLNPNSWNWNARAAAALLILGGLAGQGRANSYAMRRMAKEKVPVSVETVAAWHGNVLKVGEELFEDLGEKVPEPGAIERFLKKGRHSPNDPFQDKYRELKERERKAYEAASKNIEETFEGNPKREAEMKAFEAEKESLRVKYGNLYRSEGAFTDEKGEIILWRLQSLQVLRIEGREGLCFLELPEGEAVKLVHRKSGVALAKLPGLPEENLKLYRDFLPATGRHAALDRRILDSFLAHGEINDISIPGHAMPRPQITTHWFKDRQFHISKNASRDPSGNVILGSGMEYGSFACVFLDADKRLWRARLLADTQLQLDNGRETPAILEHRELAGKGHGQPSPVGR